MTPTITFAIPFYRGLDYLRAAIDSVVAQTRHDWRLVVVDDGGPEPAAAAVVSSYDDARMRYVRYDDNVGLAGNWNRCLDLADTEFVTLLHADDELLPTYADRMIAAHRRHPEAVATYCRAVVIDSDGRSRRSVPDLVKRVIEPRRHGDQLVVGEAGLAAIMRGQFIFCPTLCYDRALLGARRFDAAWSMVLDLDLITALLLDGATLIGDRRPGYRYRRHRGSESHRLTASSQRFREEIAIHRRVHDLALARGWSKAAESAGRMPTVRLHLAYRAIGDLARRDVGAARTKLALLGGRHLEPEPDR